MTPPARPCARCRELRKRIRALAKEFENYGLMEEDCYVTPGNEGYFTVRILGLLKKPKKKVAPSEEAEG